MDILQVTNVSRHDTPKEILFIDGKSEVIRESKEITDFN